MEFLKKVVVNVSKKLIGYIKEVSEDAIKEKIIVQMSQFW